MMQTTWAEKLEAKLNQITWKGREISLGRVKGWLLELEWSWIKVWLKWYRYVIVPTQSAWQPVRLFLFRLRHRRLRRTRTSKGQRKFIVNDTNIQQHIELIWRTSEALNRTGTVLKQVAKKVRQFELVLRKCEEAKVR